MQAWHIINHKNLITRHKTQKGTRNFLRQYGGRVPGSHSGETKRAAPRFHVFERQGHHRVRLGREAHSVMRSAKQQVEKLCCKLPFAFSQINAFLEPYKAQIFPEGRPASLAINGFACSGDVKRTTNEVLSNVVRSKQKGPFTSTQMASTWSSQVVLQSS